MAYPQGFEPQSAALETVVLPVELRAYKIFGGFLPIRTEKGRAKRFTVSPRYHYGTKNPNNTWC